MAPNTVNIVRENKDPFYRYKMEVILSKIEGKGNGIKTVIPNLASVAQSLARPPAYVIKYFGFELGAQTNINPADDRWIINGAHEASKLQDYLDGFIQKFVLCRKCKNPETEMEVKDDTITLDCKACGQLTDVDPRAKLSSYILKNEPKKGKKDKAAKKAARKARKEANGENGNGDSNSDNADEDGDFAGSDDELTRQIKEGAKTISDAEPKEVEWTVDTSEAAVKARALGLSEDLKRNLVLNEDEEAEDGDNAYELFGPWIIDTAKEKGGINNVENVEVYMKAKESGIETNHRTLTVLAQTLFTDNIVKEIEKRAPMLKKMITSPRHEKAFMGGTERFVGKEKPNLIPQISAILIQYYNEDLITEEFFKDWGTKASKKYVDISTSRKVRKSAEQFMTWLETAEEEDSDDDDE
jgi:translation initiation factor 5